MFNTAARLYLDHNASSPLRPEVQQVLQTAMTQLANPSSLHQEGQGVRFLLDQARRQVAAAVNVRAEQVVFTSSGTEANNLALRGALGVKAGRLLTTAVEHDCICNTAQHLAEAGHKIEWLELDAFGRVTPAVLEAALAAGETALVSIMAANNETGVMNDIPALAAVCAKHGVWFHTDAVQLLGHAPCDFTALGVDMLTLSFHKIGAPQGIGALILKNELQLMPQLTGGSQERKRRAGTENVLGAVGAGAACEALDLAAEQTRYADFQQELVAGLAKLPHTQLVAQEAVRLPHVATLVTTGVVAQDALIGLDMAGIAVSQGSACSSGKAEPSHVLQTLGLAPELAMSGVRVSAGWNTPAAAAGQFVAAYRQVIAA